MYAIFHDLGVYKGYKEIEYEGEEQTFEVGYILTDVLPDALRNVPEGHCARVNVVGGQIVVTYVEIPASPNPQVDELTSLKLAMAEMAETYEQTITELQIALAEIADIVAGGEIDG